MNYTKEVSNQNLDPLINKAKVVTNPLVAGLARNFDKHKKDSAFILGKSMTPYEAFKTGCEQAIASYIQLGNEGQVTQRLVLGPQVKSQETKDGEKIIKSLLKNINSVKFIKKQDTYYAIHKGISYNFSSILEKADLNQIKFKPEELDSYHALLNSPLIQYKPYLSTLASHSCSELTMGEKEAINIYTGSAYRLMNSFLRGQLDGVVDDYSSFLTGYSKAEKINVSIKEILLHTAVTISGLNKLPDYTPQPGSNGEVSRYAYRGETSIPESVLTQRKWAVLSGGKVTKEMGFISTAFERPAEGFFNESSKAGIMFENLKGKKITNLSQFGDSEREVLFPPTQVQWLHHKEIVVGEGAQKMHLFIAKPVTVPTELPTIEDTIAKEARNIFVNHISTDLENVDLSKTIT